MSVTTPRVARVVGVGTSEGVIAVWDMTTGAVNWTARAHTSRVVASAFSPDGRVLATAGADGSAKLWDVRRGVLLHELREIGGALFALTFSPDGRTLAVGVGRQLGVRDIDNQPVEIVEEKGVTTNPVRPGVCARGVVRRIVALARA